MNESDIAIRYVIDLVDRATAPMLAKDRQVQRSIGETSSAMRRQAEQAAGSGRTIASAAERTAHAYSHAGSTSMSSARQQREAATIGVTAYEKLAVGAETYERRARTALSHTEGHLRQTHGALRDLARQGIALGGTYLGYQAVKGAIDTTVQLAKETDRLTNATGLSAREASGLLTVTTARGISTSQLTQALVKLERADAAVTKGTDKQRTSIASLSSIAHTFTGHQAALADRALHAARGSDAQVHALAGLRASLIGEASAHRVATAGRQTATLSQAQQYTMTKQQIAAWHEHQRALAAGDRVANATYTANSQRQKTAVSDALSAASATNKQADALHRLGLTQADITRGSTDTHFLLEKVAEGLNKVPAGAGRTDLLQTVFGRSAVRFAPVLAHMNDELRIANQYGATFGDKGAKSFHQLEDSELRLKYAHQGLQIAFTQDVQPMLLGLEKGAGSVAKAWSQPGLNLDERMTRSTRALDKLDIGGKIATAIRLGLPLMAKAAVHAAPVIGGAFLTGFAHAGLPGDALILAWGAKKLGLWGAAGKLAGKTFFARFLETDIGQRIAARIGLGGKTGGGVLGKATGLLGATPETPMWVRMIGTPIGAPGVGPSVAGGPVSAAEKEAGQVGRASAGSLALRAVPIVGAAALLAQLPEDGKHFIDILDKVRGKLLALPTTQLERIAAGLKRDGDAGDKTAEQMATAAETVLHGRLGQALKETEGNFAGMRISTRAHLKDILAATRDNMGTIAHELGSKSAAGKQALAQNYQDAAGEIRKSMQAGLISTKTGMSEIEDLLSKRLQVYGFSKADAHRFNQTTSVEANRGHATGGYVASTTGRGTDAIPIVVGAGESVNTVHQQREINTGLAIAKAATAGRYRWGHLDDIYSNVTARHADAIGYARGGVVSQVGLGGVHPGVLAAARAIEQHFPGLTITSSTGGTHAAGSYHYLGEALDIGGAPGLMNAAAGWILHSGMARQLAEGIHNPNLSIKDGHQVDPSFWGSTVWAQHANHIHIALAGALGRIRGGAVAGGGAGRGPFQPLAHVMTRMPGMLGGVVQGALNLDWAGADHAAKVAFAHGASTGPVKGGVATLSQLEKAWSRHGPRRMEWIMGQIALAESAGRLNATNLNTNGTIDRGPWQANSTWGRWSTMSMGNLDRAAEAAAHIWRAQGLGAWQSDPAFEKYVRGKHATGPGQFARGGYAWGGWHGNGTDTTVHRPTLFGAGERGPERVTIQPMAAAASKASSGRGAIELWDTFMAHRAQKFVTELEGLGVTGEAKRRAKVILSALPAALAHESFAQLLATQHELKHTVDAHHHVSTSLAAAKKTVTTIQQRITSERKSGASQATIDHLTAREKSAQAAVKALSGSDSRLSARQQRLTAVLKLVAGAEGSMIDRAAKRAQTIVDNINSVETRTQRAMRRKNIDPSSSVGLALQLHDSTGEVKHLQTARSVLDRQIARARHLGDHSRVSSLLDQRRQVSDTLDETRTTRTERRRQRGQARAQEGVDAAGVWTGLGQSSLTAYDIAHRGDLNTAAGMRGKAAAITGTFGTLANQAAAYSGQAAAAKAAGDMNTYHQAIQSAIDTTNQLAQAQADAADLITQAALQQTQDAVDNSQFGVDTTQGGLESLQISQQLLGTAGTAGGNKQLADYITNTIIPAMQTKLAADQAKLVALQSAPNPDLTAIHQTLLDIQGDQNQIGHEQVDALNDLKANTEPLKEFGGSAAFSVNGQVEVDPSLGVGI